MTFLGQYSRSSTQHDSLRGSVKRVATDQHGDWSIEITRRSVGMTVARKMYCVTARRRDVPHDTLYLRGFASQAAALEAARRMIDLRHDRSHARLRRRRPKRKPPSAQA